MYIPDRYADDDPEAAAELIAEHGFGLLVTVDAGGAPNASHLPLLHDATAGPRGSISGHMARANPQWRQFDDDRDVLVVFSGPHAYVSPSWYEVHPAVPTWNYAAVHVYGKPRIIDDPARVRDTVRRLVDRHESGFEQPWAMDLPGSYERSMLRAIVAFEIDISRVESKFKLSQNQSEADRRNVAHRLESLGFDDAAALAALMRRREGASSGG